MRERPAEVRSLMETAAHPTDAPLAGRARWIIGPKQDLLWFIGGGLSGYALFWLHAGLKLDMVMVWFLWVTFFDVPHFFGTYSRTYFDRVEWHRRRPLLLGSLAWLFAGPLAVGASALLHRAGVASYQVPVLALVALVGVWAYIHVARQHFGLMRLYARKNGDMRAVDRHLDWWTVHLALLAPGLGFAVLHPEIRQLLGLGPELHLLEQLLVGGTAAVTAAAVLVLIARQFVRRRHGLPVNLPKLLYLAVVLPFYAFVCYHPATRTAPIIGFIAFVTISHDIHYHALIWFHHRNRYHAAGTDPAQFGLAARLSRNLPTFFGCAIGFSAVLTFAACSFGVIPGCAPVASAGDWVLFGEITARELLVSLIFGLQFHHYFLDQFIWRPGKDADLRHDLRLAPAG